ncbi:hypothetical protein Ahy_B04g070412 isoform D [Arachis hypogaea]|uniref:Uncharacterized protein n=1 Tax=Arachis hypogaea TaxID=3818 RepID=A0A444ZGR0_ARAHY|nr:hypothetical protein Ahy_B04g070412 isoform D [Arachis hypogaea]
MGDPEADVENEIGHGSRGDVTILPTLVRSAVLKAVCAGFEETTEPPVCLSGGWYIETNECLERNGGCWKDERANISACRDTFRGRVCECPVVKGVQYKGDGYTSCEGMPSFPI